MLLAIGHRQDALDQYHRALEIAEGLRSTHETDLVLLRDLADCFSSIAKFYEATDRVEACRWYQNDLDIWSKWPRDAVSGSLDQNRRAEANRNIARCMRRSG